MSSKATLGTLLETEMDRKQFLGFVGASSLVVLGISGIIKGISGVAGRHVKQGYGSSTYGENPSAQPVGKR